MGKVLLLIAIIVVSGDAQNRPLTCRNPNNRRGECISLNKCSALVRLLSNSPLTTDSIRFLKQSECPGNEGGIPNYCCTDDVRFAKKSNIFFPPEHEPEYKPSNGVGMNMPHRYNCGSQQFNYRILSGDESDIGDFPWMVLIEYRKNGERKLSCAGSIINQRYILTAAHCVTPRFIAEIGTPTLIRLGDHNTANETDCTPDTNDCNLPIVEIGIEKIIPHEHYDSFSRSHTNDIALIRLNQNIPEKNPFIEPICLPSNVEFPKSQVGANLTVAGWGRTEHESSSNVKLKLVVPVISNAYCTERYATQRVNISSSQLCAGGNYLQDSCRGDSGGPLMAFVDTLWVLEGIVSFGYWCGIEGWPAVYTRVHDFENWIMQHLEP